MQLKCFSASVHGALPLLKAVKPPPIAGAYTAGGGMKIRGYHGTTRSIAEDLVARKSTFRVSSNSGDWLGRGTYFFQDAPYRALAWARRHRCPNGEEAAVVECELDLSRRLDLLDVNAFQLLDALYPLFARYEAPENNQGGLTVRNGHARIQALPNKPLGNNPIQNDRDRAFLNWALNIIERRDGPIEAVRCAFLFGQALHPSSFLFDESHVQVLIRHPRAIGKPRLHKF